MAISLLASGNIYFIGFLVVVLIAVVALSIACDDTNKGSK